MRNTVCTFEEPTGVQFAIILDSRWENRLGCPELVSKTISLAQLGVAHPVQAKNNAIAAAEELRRQLEEGEETSAERWRTQQREMNDKLTAAVRMAAAMKTEYGNAVRL